MNSISKYADTATRQAIAKAVGVGLTAVSNAVVRGSFPPAWYDAMERAGLEPPRNLFAWKRVHDDTPSLEADGSPACQDDVETATGSCKGAA